MSFLSFVRRAVGRGCACRCPALRAARARAHILFPRPLRALRTHISAAQQPRCTQPRAGRGVCAQLQRRRRNAQLREPVAVSSMAAAVASLRAKLLDQSLGLPQRFRVLFSLRGVGTPDAVDALLAGASSHRHRRRRTCAAPTRSRLTACGCAAAQRWTTPPRCAGMRWRLRLARCRRASGCGAAALLRCAR
jgi:hypothetical protein